MTSSDTYDRQVAIELDSLRTGKDRFLAKEAEAKHSDNSKPSMLWINKNATVFSEYLVERMQQIKEAPGNRKPVYYVLIRDLDPYVLAYHTLRTLLSPEVRSGDAKHTSAAIKISNQLIDALNFEKFRDKEPVRYKIHMELAKKSHRKFNTRQLLTQWNVVPIQWSRPDKAAVGVFLISCAVDLFKHWELITVNNARSTSTPKMIKTTASLDKWLSDATDYIGELMPIQLPMVHKPLPWSDPFNGGYLTDVYKKITAVRTRNDEYLETLEDVDMDMFYDALNAVQETGYAINKQVLEVMQWCWKNNVVLGSEGSEVLPDKRELPIPKLPIGYGDKATMKQRHPEVYKRYQRECAIVFDRNSRLFSKRIAAHTCITIAERFKDEEAIYFPHNADFRGRIYPLPTHLNPQGTDLSKGLLQFSKGKRLGEDGAFWLHVHAANCWGVDKVSLSDRVEWTQNNLNAILDSALNPTDGACFWMEADKPVSALAVAFELLKYQVQGDDLVSHLPIGMDGSCNGLQNFSAMLKDSIGGKATNLIPGDEPNDIYAQVAGLVIEQVDKDAMTGHLMAIRWQGNIDRSTVKQPVMTLPYGATLRGMRGQLEDWIKKHNPNLFDGTESWDGCHYLAELTYDAIGKVVVAAVDAMGYLRSVAKLLSSVDMPITWETPVGFPVLQHYMKYDSRRVEVFINGQRTTLSIYKDTYRLDKHRQANGIAPNFVHSLDSSHLMLTVLEGKDNGLSDWCMVHDSFAVHAADTTLLHACIRQSFVDMYSHDVLQKFHRQILQQLPEKARKKMPPLPEPGDLELELIKDSEYFFA